MSNNEVVKLIECLNNQIIALSKQLKDLQEPPKKQKFYSYKEAAVILRITVDGLKSRIKRGQMVRITNNNRPLIAHAEIMRFLGNQNPDGGFGALLNIITNLLFPKQTRFEAYC
jgi:hypothetical protein